MGGSREAPGGVAPQPRWAPGARAPIVGPTPSPGGAVKRRRAGSRHLLLRPPAKTGGMFPAQEEADRTVFVGNLEARVREEILYELFLQVPSVGKG